MKAGSKLITGKLYYTKDGCGNIIPFNEGIILDERGLSTRKRGIGTAVPAKYTRDVWHFSIARHIKDIAVSKTAAKKITYPNGDIESFIEKLKS